MRRCSPTLRSEVSRRLAQGQNVVLDIDVQGAEQVIAREKDCVSIFILPPSMSELHRRLEGRGTESPEQIAMRQKIAVREIALKNHYRYNVINDDVAACAARIAGIIEAERYNTARYTVEIPE